MTRQARAFSLLLSALALSLGAAAYCVTADPKTAPKGAALSILLATAVLPVACVFGAAREMEV